MMNQESMGLVADTMRSKSKQALLLWVDGVREACCLHRLIIYSLRSKQLAIRTGQCFLLNGFIFLGSIFVLKSVIIPALEWILPGHCPQTNSPESCSFSSILELYQFLRGGLVQLFNAFWFYPLYIFSLILSNIWYNDIAKHGFFALENYGARDTKLSDQKESQILQSTVHREKSTDLEGFMISIAEQLYSVLLLTFFFVEVYVTGLVPYIGKALNFMLLSWMYAYYCFEYKWNLSGLSLDKRLDFFESNWAFFAGFGNPCVLAIFLFSPLVSYGVMAILFPLFVLTATGSEADKIVALPRRKWRGAGLGRLPIFFIADYMSHSQIDSWSCANFSSQDVCQHLNVRHLINWENLTFSPANVKTRDSFKEDEDNPEDASLETLFAEITSPNEREQGSMK